MEHAAWGERAGTPCYFRSRSIEKLPAVTRFVSARILRECASRPRAQGCALRVVVRRRCPMKRFSSRIAAAAALAENLAHYRGADPLILAIPRGAVPMGRALADALGGEFDVVLVRKLGAPGNPELAVGAIDETGWMYVADFAGSVGVDAAYLARERQAQLEV